MARALDRPSRSYLDHASPDGQTRETRDTVLDRPRAGGVLVPRPSPYLDLFLVPADLAALPDHDALTARLAEVGAAEGRSAGPRAGSMVVGGYRGVRADRPPHPTLYANRQGGFRVVCPDTEVSVVPAFVAALQAWREGGVAVLEPCPSCGGSHPFEALITRPPAAIGAGAVVLVDAGSAELTDAGTAAFREILGEFRVVGSRR
jgi:hypothetical protein